MLDELEAGRFTGSDGVNNRLQMFVKAELLVRNDTELDTEISAELLND